MMISKKKNRNVEGKMVRTEDKALFSCNFRIVEASLHSQARSHPYTIVIQNNHFRSNHFIIESFDLKS
jgi:hypothetical protein